VCVHTNARQALAAHLINFVDKSALFRASAAVSGCSAGRQLLLLLGVKGSSRLSLPVLKDNLARVLRGAGGAGPGRLGSVLHISCHEEDGPDSESDAVGAEGRVRCCVPVAGCCCLGAVESTPVPVCPRTQTHTHTHLHAARHHTGCQHGA
jgi:hypothetical protein